MWAITFTPDNLSEFSSISQYAGFKLDEAKDALQAAIADAHSCGYSIDQISKFTGLLPKSVSTILDTEREYQEVFSRGLAEGMGIPDFS